MIHYKRKSTSKKGWMTLDSIAKISDKTSVTPRYTKPQNYFLKM